MNVRVFFHDKIVEMERRTYIFRRGDLLKYEASIYK